MTKEQKPELLDEQIRSLHWAISELDKQKSSLEKKIGATHKREETEDIIKEVLAQKEALEKRIGALREGLDRSQESTTDNPSELQEEISNVQGKLEVAKERLTALEQDKYLEELSRNLSGQDPPHQAPLENHYQLPQEQPQLSSLSTDPEVQADHELEPNQPISDTMTEPANRLSATQAESGVTTTLPTPSTVQPRTEFASTGPISCSEETSQSIREVAIALDLEPEAVLEKGVQAVLRMIARNGNRITFPLDVKQVESLG